ncbi:uncharacterized protein LOC108275085 [Ictalurus punctatus]|uniref:Uncharacterized protein LOC108275085 n=1 Tax=Ictalurus punctatus TaxID=7998 RepID=A0A2D0SEP2_ICTPU|nr:uncharacterized protein LOC108275085 [Ictalurus punctatus]
MNPTESYLGFDHYPALMDVVHELIPLSANIILSLSALPAAFHLFRDHRAPSVGFFLIACSSFLAVIPLPPALSQVQRDLEWAGEILGPSLSAFSFLWLSEDRWTAHVLLIGTALLPMLSDWLSEDGLVIMTRCVSLSAFSCALTVCMFAASGTGVVGSVALSLPALVAPRVGAGSMTSLISSQGARGLLGWSLKVIMAVGCWTTKSALNTFLQDLKGWDRTL